MPACTLAITPSVWCLVMDATAAVRHMTRTRWRCFRPDMNVATICVGALPLGKSGALKGKKGTTYNSEVRREALKGFGVNVVHEPIVVDDKMITSWNPSTAINVALLLLEDLTSKDNADKVRKLMGF